MAVIKYIDPETKQPIKIPISGGGGSSSLAGLSDVELDAAPSEKQVLTYDAENEKWVNADAPEGGGVDVKADGQILEFTGGVNSAEVKFSDHGSGTSAIRFGVDENGNYGYYKVGADTLTPFKSKDDVKWIFFDDYTDTVNFKAIASIGDIINGNFYIVADSFNKSSTFYVICYINNNTITTCTRCYRNNASGQIIYNWATYTLGTSSMPILSFDNTTKTLKFKADSTVSGKVYYYIEDSSKSNIFPLITDLTQ